MILLYHEGGASGQVGLQEGMVEGFPMLKRRFDVIDHFIAVDTEPDVVTKADAEAILQLPGVRLATAKEQNQYAALQKKAASAISEQVGG